MSTSTPYPRRRARVPASGAPVRREPADRALIGRRVVRRRATGMNAPEAAAALERVRWEQHLDRDREDLFGDERGPAELAEWERIVQLLTTTGGVYDPAADAVVQDELAAETAAAAVREAEQEKARRTEARADELQALAEAGALHRAAPRRGDEDARDALAQRPGWFLVQDDVDGWLAHALATHRGHYADPATRDTAAGLLPEPVRVHAALLAALHRLDPDTDVDELGFAARLTAADPDAVRELTTFLDRAAGDRG
ncbi:hypothetical protein [Streptomyces sp. NPDC058861]|uniref:hypothetical protein n=1 Tax=Streptomyces sp. NPDC058861 TaxID=3346653 RepID=UPI0036CBB30A